MIQSPITPSNQAEAHRVCHEILGIFKRDEQMGEFSGLDITHLINKALNSAFERGREAGEWQPIETVDKDNDNEILACWLPSGVMGIIRWSMEEWMEESRAVGEPTVWMPLPKPPEAVVMEGK